MLHALSFWYFAGAIDKNGWGFGRFLITTNKHQDTLLILLITALTMFCIELFIRIRVDGQPIISLNPKLRERAYFPFLIESLLHLIGPLTLLLVAKGFYATAIAYNNSANGVRFIVWTDVFPLIFVGALFFLPAYVLLTRALQHDVKGDAKEISFLPFLLICRTLLRFTPWQNRLESALRRHMGTSQDYDVKQAILGLLVKVFFVPIMTVFFFDQFESLQKNWGYIYGNMATAHSTGNAVTKIKDFYNISFSMIFLVDVGLAWCGYVFASRWIRNTIESTEPTFLGWFVALMCYPPFSVFLDFYYVHPGDHDFLQFNNTYLIITLAILAVMSYIIYVSATVFFGLRFSNLTNRGIITRGPYAFIRHPAYMAKNLSWWLVMLPVILIQAFQQNNPVLLTQILSLVIMTGLYYYRAITEERHLAAVPEYREYMEKTRYRFIPGLL